jgi:hypothetical protein
MASAANGGGTKMADTVAPVSATASATVSKIGTLSGELLAALAGGDTGHELGAVVEAELGVAPAKGTGDALDEDLGVFVNENGHEEVSG